LDAKPQGKAALKGQNIVAMQESLFFGPLFPAYRC